MAWEEVAGNGEEVVAERNQVIRVFLSCCSNPEMDANGRQSGIHQLLAAEQEA